MTGENSGRRGLTVNPDDGGNRRRANTRFAPTGPAPAEPAQRPPLRLVGGYKKRVLGRLIDAVLPDPYADEDGMAENIIDFFDDYLSHGPSDLKKLLPLGLYFLEISSIFYPGGGLPFSFMSREARRRYLAKREDGSFLLLRELVIGVKGLVLFKFYSYPEIGLKVGYDPDPFIKKVMREREINYGSEI